jgi:hypothetical protein
MKKPTFLLLALALGAVQANAAMDCLYPSHPDAAFKRIELNDADFKEIASNSQNASVTKAFFNSLVRGSEQRVQICDSRAIARRVAANKLTQADFSKYFPKWLGDYWGASGSPSEFDRIVEAQINLASSGMASL